MEDADREDQSEMRELMQYLDEIERGMQSLA